MGFPAVALIGGGQLARMLQQAAIPLGVRLQLLADRDDDSAAQVIRDVHVGDYRDLAALRSVVAGCAVVTFDHEHVPTKHLHALAETGIAVRPGPDALLHAQDKLAMRERLTAAGIPVPRWRRVGTVAELAGFAAELGGWPVVLKTARGGYDGRGVWLVESAAEAEPVLAAAASASGPGLLAEERVDFVRELAVVLARSPYGQVAVYPVVETVQRGGICREVLAPAPGLRTEVALAAVQTAMTIAAELDCTGVLAVEMFETARGVLVNELAMRPHNSAHWTIDGAVTSQFEQHLRAVLDLPLGTPTARAPASVMVNVLGGDDPDVYRRYLHCMARDPALRIHMYGKQVRPGRKIGHVTVSGSGYHELRERAWHAADYLSGAIDG
ncbi:MAG TPA: 5-(carboxyamino)imidazole ribonucleotide synthase [Actinomycetes bacterium]|nr:5-(carboxyamino)imidazole ribonucleotide synthase [Actinomycetes bacterium]